MFFLLSFNFLFNLQALHDDKEEAEAQFKHTAMQKRLYHDTKLYRRRKLSSVKEFGIHRWKTPSEFILGSRRGRCIDGFK
jgi:hypothetical protein